MAEHRICTRCVMDTSAADIAFDGEGVCSYCRALESRLGAQEAATAARPRRRAELLERVRNAGRGKAYDCVVGVSGGVDSSYALYLAVSNGLRPLAVHLDNGWNSELAAHNIANLVESLGVDLYTHVIDWAENRDLQVSFFKANVVDIELLMDNAMLALNYRQARRQRVRHILAGTNTATEGMALPPAWRHYKLDARNIRRIHARFGQVPIRTHPLLSTLGYLRHEFLHRISWVSFLDYFPYRKAEALAVLERECRYRPYPYKHYESVFTRFYQAHILSGKFGYDKRRVHLSTLVVSGQMTRDEALAALAGPAYPDRAQEEQDRLFVIKKLGFTEESFREYMAAPGVPHAVYGTEEPLWNALVRVYRLAKPR